MQVRKNNEILRNELIKNQKKLPTEGKDNSDDENKKY